MQCHLLQPPLEKGRSLSPAFSRARRVGINRRGVGSPPGPPSLRDGGPTSPFQGEVELTAAHATTSSFRDEAPWRQMQLALPHAGRGGVCGTACASDTSSALWRSGVIGAAPAREELALLVEHLRLAGRELAAEFDDSAARRQVARHRRVVVIDAQIDRRDAAAHAPDQRPVRRQIDERRDHAAVGVTPLRVDHPLLAPGGGELDAVVVHCHDLEAEPLVIGAPRNHLLNAFDCPFVAHRALRHGVTTTLPITSLSWINRRPAAAWSSGNTLSMTGFILPSWISCSRACKLSS